MSFLFTCPHCGARTQIPESFIGQTGPCHACGKAVQIAPPDSATGQTTPPTRSSVGVMIALALGLTCILIAAAGVSLVVAMPNLRSKTNARKLTVARANLKMIVSAMHAYHGRYGRFPPPYTKDAKGKPMHSWRVALLPYLGPEASALHAQFKLDEPWDSKHNLAVAQNMPAVYRSPADDKSVSPIVANYFVITGPQTMFPENGNVVQMVNNLDPLNHTILVVESVARNNIWTEPLDLKVSDMTFELNTFAGGDMSGPHPGGVLVGMADGSTFLIEDETPAEMVEAMTTRSGNDEGPPEL